ncbi:importin subunit alpha-3-like [Drosophila rhopaloa]|uniref:Importin subunit alpha n=1 Tax=Drosophila rhopaloa TaxID=1041015 RepID=A0A6P4FGG1_DRORH|nr:importin subunit alpha-3-like [Drosophila rhopaloa]
MPPNRLNIYRRRSKNLIEQFHRDLDSNPDGIEPAPPSKNLINIIQKAGDASRPVQQLSAVQDIRQLLSSKSPPIKDLIQGGILPILVECLKKTSPKSQQFEAAWALTNIASGNSEQTTQVVAAGAVPLFLELLKSPDLDLCEQAIWALANIIGDGPLLRDFVIRLGVVPPLLSLIQPDMPGQFLANVTMAIGNLCRHHDPPISAETIGQILPTLDVLIHHEDTEILVSTLWAISFLAGGGQDQIQMVIESGVLGKLISLMGHKDIEVGRAAMRAVGNILTGTDEQCQKVLNHHPLSYFPSVVLFSNTDEVHFLWRATARNEHWVQAFINGGMLHKIIGILKKGGMHEKAVAARAISNLTVGCNEEQLLIFIRKDVLQPFCDLLIGQFEQITLAVLNGLNNMLNVSNSHEEEVAQAIDECGGLAKIEDLQTHENVYIYKQAQEIIERYYGYENSAA